MTTSATKEWLNRGFDIYKRLQVKQAHLETLNNIVSRYEPRDIETYRADNVSETTFIKWSETKKEVEEMERALFQIDDETEKALRLLHNPNEYAVLYCRYVRRLSWDDVGKACKYARASVFRFHKDGVDHIGCIIYDRINNFETKKDPN